jgi:pilus assembly protein FimV
MNLPSLIKTSRTLVVMLALLICFPAFGLGLGDAKVNSYLNQPLSVRIELISQSEEEAATVTAGLASAEDLEMMGLRGNISVPLHFEVSSESGLHYIDISSRLAVSEPVVQLVIEARWSGGRMLREYTLFLDPPTFASIAPKVSSPAVEPSYPDPEQLDVVETVKRPVVRETVPDPVLDPEPEVIAESLEDSQNPVVSLTAEPGLIEPALEKERVTVPDAAEFPEIEAPEEVVAVTADTEEPVAERPVVTESIPEPAAEEFGESFGPVQSGDTLWQIASNFNEGTDFSINQTMLAIQRLNPEAFSGNNINSLRRGSILRMPGLNETTRLTRRDAMLEAIRQEQAYMAMRSGAAPEELPTISDAASAVLSVPEAVASTVAEAEPEQDGLLQLVPPSLSGEKGGANNNADATGALSSQEVEEVLARTEEELANAQQENAYLNERIRELEAQISGPGGDSQDASTAGVSDNTLAGMEESLRDQRQTDEQDVSSTIAAEEEIPWYQGNSWWLAAGLIGLIALVVWALRKLGSAPVADQAVTVSDEEEVETVESIRTEAEDILRSLDDPPNVIPIGIDEAVEMDADDPEVKLDLARAYISMGDIDAARKMLDEVLEAGNEEQVTEAREMMEEL